MLRKDPFITLYGCRSDSLLPWDRMAGEWPEHVALPLGEEFLDEWQDPLSEEHLKPPRTPDTVMASGKEDVDRARREAEQLADELTEAEERWNVLVDDLEAAEAKARSREVGLRSVQTDLAASPEQIRTVEARASAAAERVRRAEEAFAAKRRLGAGHLGRTLKAATGEEAAWVARAEEARSAQTRLLSRLRETESSLAQARAEVERLRWKEGRVREALVPRREAAMKAAMTLQALEEPAAAQRALRFEHVTITRSHQVLRTLSLGEWALRASGHRSSPRFVLELPDETLWLYRGEWFAADPHVGAEDVMILTEGRVPTSVDLRTAEVVWERDGGRCVHCGAVGGLEIDRVVAESLGGSDEPANLRLLCRNCARTRSHDR